MYKGREIIDHLNDILFAIADIEEFLGGMSYEVFAEDKRTVNAVIRSLEVLGEATKRIPIIPSKAPRHSLEQDGRDERRSDPRLHGCRLKDCVEGRGREIA